MPEINTFEIMYDTQAQLLCISLKHPKFTCHGLDKLPRWDLCEIYVILYLSIIRMQLHLSPLSLRIPHPSQHQVGTEPVTALSRYALCVVVICFQGNTQEHILLQ